jgi:hypothetical protein
MENLIAKFINKLTEEQHKRQKRQELINKTKIEEYYSSKELYLRIDGIINACREDSNTQNINVIEWGIEVSKYRSDLVISIFADGNKVEKLVNLGINLGADNHPRFYNSKQLKLKSTQAFQKYVNDNQYSEDEEQNFINWDSWGIQVQANEVEGNETFLIVKYVMNGKSYRLVEKL